MHQVLRRERGIMGYRFTLETANTVANLAFGKVMSCYRDIFSNRENHGNFRSFLDTFDHNFYIGNDDKYWHRFRNHPYFDYDYHHYRHRREFYHDIVHSLKTALDKWENLDSNPNFKNDSTEPNDIIRDREVIELLGVLSDLMKTCRVKSLLLPRPYDMSNESDNSFMTSERTLKRLLKWHPYDSCLILQPTDRPSRENITIFDVFPHFDCALQQIEKWSAVMFWNKEDDFIFAPVENYEELEEMFELMHYERNDSFVELKRFVASKKKTVTPHFYLHLSDLHFGASTVPVNGRRLSSLVERQVDNISRHNDDYTLNFVITGDVVDSPKKRNNTDYLNFYDTISRHVVSSAEPLFAIGNHDVNPHGLAFGNNNQSLVDSLRTYPRVEIDDDIKVIFLIFNSNTDGKFSLAEGEIGIEQMSEMGNNLDKISNIADYKLVAVLHHHLIDVPKPEWRTKRWYEKLLPDGFLERALHLKDADTFKEWLQNRNVKLVIHGHKHVPFIGKDGSISVVACGSSTGQIQNVDPKKTYISYNVLTFNPQTVTCTLYAEDLLGSGAKDVQTVVLEY
jgi:3',5'-cyclic AMP phosphodiesterase CpdA